jgi:hypothetical protein
MYEGSKGFDGFSGLLRTGVTAGVCNRPVVLFVVNKQKTHDARMRRAYRTRVPNDPENPSNPFEPST